LQNRPNLSILALISFVASFIFARTFTIFNPQVILMAGDVHIHHFWYGLAMLAIGGWLGISYNDPRIERLAAILFGAGGGIIGDEAGLLLTLTDYWTEITYTIVIAFVALTSAGILLKNYSRVIRAELGEFTGKNASLYIGVFLVAISMALVIETSDVAVLAFSTILTSIGAITILSYFIQRLRTRRHH